MRNGFRSFKVSGFIEERALEVPAQSKAKEARRDEAHVLFSFGHKIHRVHARWLGHTHRLADSMLLPRVRRLPHSCHSSGLETQVSFAHMAVESKRMALRRTRRGGGSRGMSCTVAEISGPLPPVCKVFGWIQHLAG